MEGPPKIFSEGDVTPKYQRRKKKREKEGKRKKKRKIANLSIDSKQMVQKSVTPLNPIFRPPPSNFRVSAATEDVLPAQGSFHAFCDQVQNLFTTCLNKSDVDLVL